MNHAIEILGDGQQCVAYGDHPDTKQPYRWHQDRGPFNVPREDLPCIDASIARALLDQAVELLKCEFGYTVHGASKITDNNGSGQRDPADWPKLMRNILDGRDLHDSIVSFAASMAASGIPAGAVERKLARVEIDRDGRIVVVIGKEAPPATNPALERWLSED
jgi:hypothetical protein